MSIRDARLDRAIKSGNVKLQRLIRKENEQWELAGCARQDGDKTAELQHTQNAREYSRMAQELT